MSNPGGASISTEQLKARYIGTGHADMTKYVLAATDEEQRPKSRRKRYIITCEWVTNIHRDTLASHVGHYDQLVFCAVAQNESVGRVRSQMLEKMIQPCGPPPSKTQEN